MKAASVSSKPNGELEAFKIVDDVLRQGVQGISDLIAVPALINLDFADVKTIMSDAGSALMGIGFGTGDNRAISAVEAAIRSPLLEMSIDGAKGVLLNFTGGPNTTLFEVNEAADIIAKAADPEATIIFGATIDERFEDQVRVTVIATGFDPKPLIKASEGRHETPVIEPFKGRDLDIPAWMRR
ncbi:MAG: ftsZ [Sporomusa sp.]|nr:ftsZ [Sporomusa sp.]